MAQHDGEEPSLLGKLQSPLSTHVRLDDEPVTAGGSARQQQRPVLHHIQTDALGLRSEDASEFTTAIATAAETSEPTAASATAVATEALFSKLQTIQHLQTEINKKHIALENLNTTLGHSRSRSDVSEQQRTPDRNTTDSFVASPSSAEPATPPRSADKRAAAQAYDRLAAGFQERQKGVDSIMEKLSMLSAAVKEFHALKPPVLFPEETESKIVQTAPIVETPVAMSPQYRLPGAVSS